MSGVRHSQSSIIVMKVSSHKYHTVISLSVTNIIQVLLLLSLASVCQAQGTGLLNSKERRALIGHLQDVRSDKIVLTDRQKLALKLETEFQKQGFSPFSPRTDPGFETGKVAGDRNGNIFFIHLIS